MPSMDRVYLLEERLSWGTYFILIRTNGASKKAHRLIKDITQLEQS